MNHHKIVFTGAPGAGKTTAIAALSDKPPVLTEVRNTDAALGKSHTTVGLDFGQVDMGDGQSIRLFGTPGQLRFEFMWRIIATDALGLVILVDNAKPDPLADLAIYLDAYNELLPTMNCAVGIGRTLEYPRPSVDDYAEMLGARGLAFPVLPVDVRRREDVLMLVDTVLFQAEARTV
ncbi:MAG: GTP-binding protein [Burkholderiales bacterium]